MSDTAPGVVLAALAPGTIDIILFPGHGQADGGIRITVPLERVALDARTPNTNVEVVFGEGKREVIEVRRAR